MGDWLEEGKAAPDFTLASDDGKKVNLKTLRGQPVVLYFYPRDDTPGCTKEACRSRSQEGIDQARHHVLGVSTDDIASHEKFRDKYELNFPLLADVDHKVAEKFGVLAKKNMYGKKSMGVQRSTYLIDAEGRSRNLEESVCRRPRRPGHRRVEKAWPGSRRGRASRGDVACDGAGPPSANVSRRPGGTGDFAVSFTAPGR